MFLWWCGGVFVVVLRLCFCGGVVVVFLWLCFCGGSVAVFCGPHFVKGAQTVFLYRFMRFMKNRRFDEVDDKISD